MTKTELKKLLAELGEELKNSVANAKKDLAQAKSVSTQINNHFAKADEIIKKLTDDETGVDVYYDHVKELATSIENANTVANTNLETITISLSAAQEKVTEMETAYQAFTAINEKIEDDETGLAAVLESASEVEASINATKTKADTYLISITTSLNTIQTQVTEMETAYQAFTAINEKIEDDETGLAAVLAESNSLRSDIEATKVTTETLFKEIGKFKDTASNYINEINGLKTAATKTVEKITKNHETSEDLKNKINAIFKVSSRDVHANYFDGRKKTLGYTSLGWLGLSIVMLIVTLILGAKFIAPLAEIIQRGDVQSVKTVTLEAFLVRFGIVTPALIATIYCLNQFSHDRRLHEKYAFKAISMLSIESSIQLLDRSLEKNQNVEERDNKVIDFAVDTIKSIYTDPVDGTSKSWILRGGNKVLQLSTEINESVGEIKKDVDKISDKVIGK